LEENLLAVVKLVRMVNMEDFELMKVGKEIELNKPNNAVACQVGLAVAYMAMTRGERELAREEFGGGGGQCSGQAEQFEMQSGGQ
jgi:hypothetical protein